MNTIFWILAAVFLTATALLIYMRKTRVVHPVYIILSTLLCVTMVFFAIVTLPKDQQPEPEPEPAKTAEGYVSDDLVNNGGSNGNDVVFNDDVDESKDTSTTGDAGVNKDGFKTVDQVVNWLSSGSAEGEKTINAIVSLSDATREDILNPANWVRVQSLVDFTYRGNNGLDPDGNLTDMGERDGKSGDIFFAFVNPINHSVVYLRGACGNVQLYTPWLQPKSSNPADYKQPGDGTETDSGTGTRPKSTVTETVESTPTTVVSNDGTSSVTDPVGSETETVSPEASPPTQDTSDDTDVSGDDTLNEGDSGNPF